MLGHVTSLPGWRGTYRRAQASSFRAELHVTAHSKRDSLHLRPPSITNSTTCLSEAHSEEDEAADAAAVTEEVAVAAVEVHMLVVGKRQSGRRRKTSWT
jgi:hypothetical protein